MPLEGWDLSCPDWEQRLREGRPLVPDLPLDVEEADRAARIYDRLKLADVIGTPTNGEAGGAWFREIVRALFGSVTPDGERQVRELFLLVPKKNNKTTGGALLMLTALLMNQRPYAPLIMTAPVIDTADIAFNAAAGAIRLDPVLSKKLHIREHVKTIVHRETKAELQIMTFDPNVLTGQKVVAALIDELHVVAKMSKAASAIRQLRGGMIPFPEAFLAFITTQSEEAPAGVFSAELQRARAVRDGKRKSSVLPVLYEFPDRMQKDAEQWRDPENWKMVTPNAGRSVSISRLEQDFADAEEKGEGELREWGSQHLNIQIGVALKADAWEGAQFWEQSIEPALSLENLLERCEVVEVGIDGGGLKDFLGLAVIGRCSESVKNERDENGQPRKRWLAWFHAWAHSVVLLRHKSDALLYKDFEAAGDLTIVDRMGDDTEELAEIVLNIHKHHRLLDKVGVDAVGIAGAIDALAAVKIPGDKFIAIPQGYKLCGAIKTMERKLAGGDLLVCDQPIMKWCVGNAKVEPRGNAILITKEASAGKIDPLMAGFNAVQLLSLNPRSMRNRFQTFAV